MLISPKVLYNNCYGKYAIPAVNVFTMEQIHALFRSGQKANAPFIVQITPVAREYANSNILLSIIKAASKLYPKAVYFVHLDHGNEQHAFDAIESNLIRFRRQKTPNSFGTPLTKKAHYDKEKENKKSFMKK